jgi:hypothetical protein
LSTAQTAARPQSKLLAYVRVFRLPNVFTALADVLMGFLLTHNPDNSQMLAVLPLLVASALMYMAGMILNDVFDVEIDRIERPERPLPSGQISLRWAKTLGFEMLFFGAVLGPATSFWRHDWRPAVVTIGLAAMILLYDRVLKSTLLGPLAMGACRFLNVLLGMSLLDGAWTEVHYLVAAGIGVYIAGVTWFARNEAEPQSHRLQLALATLVMLSGMGLLAWFPQKLPQTVEPMDLVRLFQPGVEPQRWSLFWLVLSILVGWRCVRAIVQPYSEFVQEAVRQCLVSLIVLDAAVCAAVRDVPWAIAILCLMVPMTILGRWSYST